MNKKEFIGLKTNQQLEYVNAQLKSGLSLRSLSANLEISKTTIRDRFKKINYKFDADKRQYIIDDDSITTVNSTMMTDVIYDKSHTNGIHNVNETSVIHIKGKEIKSKDNSHTLIINHNLESNIISLAEKHDKIIEVLNWFENDKSRTNVIEVIQGIKINLPPEENKEFRTTVRLNDVVWEMFKTFCTENKEFTQKDLHSMALIDYMEKHKK